MYSFREALAKHLLSVSTAQRSNAGWLLLQCGGRTVFDVLSAGIGSTACLPTVVISVQHMPTADFTDRRDNFRVHKIAAEGLVSCHPSDPIQAGHFQY